MWKQFTSINSKPTVTTYPGLPESITWFRLFLGLAYGITLGFRESQSVVTITGATGVMMGINVITFIPILYMKFYLNADTNSYKNLTFIGCINGLAVMLLVWILFFTMLHEDEEKVLNDGIQNLNVSYTIDATSNAGSEDFDESEF